MLITLWEASDWLDLCREALPPLPTSTPPPPSPGPGEQVEAEPASLGKQVPARAALSPPERERERRVVWGSLGPAAKPVPTGLLGLVQVWALAAGTSRSK